MDINDFKRLLSKSIDFKENKFHPLVWINGNPQIGENVYIGGLSEINATKCNIFIGDNCDIASFVSINSADSHKKAIGISNDISRKDITIENNVFIGSHSVIKGGAYIGHNSVVAAGSIVEGVKIPPYSLVVGNPMVVKEGYYKKKEINLIKHNKPTLDLEEKNSVLTVLKSNMISQGNQTTRFENLFCDFFNLEHGHAVAISSGSAAIYLALMSLNSKGKKIDIPSYSCVSIKNAVDLSNADSNIIDTMENSPNIDLDLIRKSNSDIAIIPHMFGIPQDLSGIKNIKVIEDCAQSLGSKVNGMYTGLQSELGVFSFYATKVITSGGNGGMVISKNKNLIDYIRDFRDFDMKNDNKLRFNFSITDIQSSIGIEQLDKLPKFIKRRDEIFEMYRDAGFNLIDSNKDNIIPIRFRAVIIVENPIKIINKLKKKGIETIIPITENELLSKDSSFKKSIFLSRNTLSLPIYPSLENESVKYIIKELRNLL